MYEIDLVCGYDCDGGTNSILAGTDPEDFRVAVGRESAVQSGWPLKTVVCVADCCDGCGWRKCEHSY